MKRNDYNSDDPYSAPPWVDLDLEGAKNSSNLRNAIENSDDVQGVTLRRRLCGVDRTTEAVLKAF